MALDYRLTTSTPALGVAAMPTSQVGQYINQQTSRAMNRNEAGRNAYQAARLQQPTQQVGVSDVATPKTDQVTNTVKMIEESNKRMASYQPQTNTGNTGNVGYNPNAQPVGQAWTPDGKLSPTRNSILSYASTWLGKPYLPYQLSTRGTDCSGLVMMVYNKFGYNITRHSATWQRDHIPGVRTSFNNLRPGDIVAWRDGSHIAIYAGNGEIIEAANSNRPILRRKLWASPNDVIGIALRLPGE